VTASHAEQTVGVSFDPAMVTPDEITARISAIGYTVAP